MAAVGRLGNVIRQDQENEQLLAAKAKFAKNTRPRAALGDLGNKPAAVASKTTANLGVKSKRALHRTEATTGLLSKQANEQDAKQQKKTIDVDIIGEALESCRITTLPANVEDIDKEDLSNPQLCAEYAQEIYQYMHKLECEFHVPPTYLNQRKGITEAMRAILVDWLIQVHNKFRLLQETLYITISILDRFLSAYDDVGKHNLQLVGVSAMLLASKYEEMYCPEIGDFVFITDNSYDKNEIRRMEAIIFKHVDFSVGKPLCLHFLRRNSKAGMVDPIKHTMAKYFMELSLVDYTCVQFLPSEIAAASLYIAMKAHEGSEWTPTLEYYSMYSESKLQPCARRIAFLITKTLSGNAKLMAVYNKYGAPKFSNVSKLKCLRSSFVTDLASEESQ